MRAITALAATLGISVAAEGVESAAQLERLLALGCEEWQGHYFSAPLDAAGFEGAALVATRRSERTARKLRGLNQAFGRGVRRGGLGFRREHQLAAGFRDLQQPASAISADPLRVH